ncbi:MAG: adenylosuccinate lyase [Schleiferiaceae bacterium]
MNYALHALSPLDGRYQKHAAPLRPYFSEFGLIRYRVLVEVRYFIALSARGIQGLPTLNDSQIAELHRIYQEFSETDAARIKEIEATINHDVKAVEYFIKERFEALGLGDRAEFIHFGLTSQDINNTAIPLSLLEAHRDVVRPALLSIIERIDEQARAWDHLPMLARTHGQPASPTRLGKEWRVFRERLSQQLALLDAVPFAGKFGGATGNFNAHSVAYPGVDWHAFGEAFLRDDLGLQRSHPTTQIEHYDHLAAYFDGLKRLNTVLIDLARDAWQYISMDYFKQKINPNEVGSSAMPHKVNPIDFENAEGNFGIANAWLEHLAAKLPISRLQRDLTDSTVLRNVGMPLGHMLLAYASLQRGLGKLVVNDSALNADLENHWEVVAEGIQTILRREGFPKPYEALKALTRTSDRITAATIANFVDGLAVAESVKAELRALTPSNYTGQ